MLLGPSRVRADPTELRASDGGVTSSQPTQSDTGRSRFFRADMSRCGADPARIVIEPSRINRCWTGRPRVLPEFRGRTLTIAAVTIPGTSLAECDAVGGA